MKILIVDDEKPARDRLKRLIGRLPEHQAIGEARNGEEAVQQAHALEPDLILMDIRMPGMDGIEAARQLLEQEQPPAIVFTTAFSDHALEAFEARAVDYLLKPVKLDRLEKTLDECQRLNSNSKKPGNTSAPACAATWCWSPSKTSTTSRPSRNTSPCATRTANY